MAVSDLIKAEGAHRGDAAIQAEKTGELTTYNHCEPESGASFHAVPV